MAKLSKCDSLRASDEYFESKISSDMLGDIEPEPGQLDHLTALISQKLAISNENLQGSISIAVFLVWMGCQFYQEGNFWSPVYKKLGLPMEQLKWQSILGECFLQAVRKYKLKAFSDNLRYIGPILAHCYVPDWYLKDYFEKVVLAIYKQRMSAQLSVTESEAKHLVMTWRNDYEGYQSSKRQLAALEQEELRLSNMCQALGCKEPLEKLMELQNKLLKNEELQELLSFPENWLEISEAELVSYRTKHSNFHEWLEQQQDVHEAREAKKLELRELTDRVKVVGNQVFEKWNDDLTETVIALPVAEIEVLAARAYVVNKLPKLIRFLCQVFMPSKFKKADESLKRLRELFQDLPIQHCHAMEPMPKSIQCLKVLQQALVERCKVVEELEELESVWAQVSAAQDEVFAVDPEELQNIINKLAQEITRYKTNLVKLGRGNFDKGKEKLDEQRLLRQDLHQLQASIPGDAPSLLAALFEAKQVANKGQLRSQLVKIREQKKKAGDRLKVYKNPLYSLNESARVFMFQGGNKAEEFLYNSLLMVEKLHKGEQREDIVLPERIAQAMIKWWDEKGQDLVKHGLSEQRLEGNTGGVYIRKPKIFFDVTSQEIKAVLPQQVVSMQQKAHFVIHGKSGYSQEVQVPVKVEQASYVSEEIKVLLNNPETLYHFEFCCGNILRSWQLKGIGWDNHCLLFNKRGELVEDGQLPQDGAYIIAPVGSTIEPEEVAQERLSGHWAGYQYFYIDLEGIDLVLIRTGEELVAFRRRALCQPMFLSRDRLNGLIAEDASVYKNQLPNLVFSISHPEEIPFYGIRIEYLTNSSFVPLEKTNVAISKDYVAHVTLADLAKEKYGLFKVMLQKRGIPVWTNMCAVIPSINLEFDKPAYAIQEQPGETGWLKFKSDHNLEFRPNAGDDGAYKRISPTQIEFDTRQDRISGTIVFYMEKKVELNVCIDIPGIRWRYSDEWKAEVDELWHEDLGEIWIKTPPTIGKVMKIALEGDKQIVSRKIRQGMAIFDLRRFSDTLRDGKKPLQQLTLICPGLPPFVLARVRTRWQVTKLRLTQRIQENNRVLLLEWEEWGRAQNKVARFWPLNIPGASVVTQEIPDGAREVETVVPVKTMPPGRYRVQLAVDDPWEIDAATLPAQGCENCKDLDIGTIDEHLQAYIGKKLEITGFIVEDNFEKLDVDYWVEVDSIDSTFEGEIRLIGNVYSRQVDKTVKAMPYNPVSFYVNDNVMPFLIDRDGDGATYCHKCKVMFWEVGHKECQRAVIEPESICFKLGG